MNCRENDLAVIVRDLMATHGGQTLVSFRAGTVVRVTTHVGENWWIEEPLRFDLRYDCGCCYRGWAHDVADRVLRPLRDPGDDAVDEMVVKIGPAPMTLTEVMERSWERMREREHG